MSGLSRSIVSCLLTVSERSTMPVVMLVFLDLELCDARYLYKCYECVYKRETREGQELTWQELNFVMPFVPFSSPRVYHTTNGKLHKYGQSAARAPIVRRDRPLDRESEACD